LRALLRAYNDFVVMGVGARYQNQWDI